MADPNNAAAIAVNLKNAYTNGKIYDLINPPNPLPSVPAGHSPLCTEAYFSPIRNCGYLSEGGNWSVLLDSNGAIKVKADTYIDFVFDADSTSIAIRPIGIAFKYTGLLSLRSKVGENNMPVGDIAFFDPGVKYGGRGAVIRVHDNHTNVTVSGTTEVVKWGYYILCQNVANGALIMIDPEVENDQT